MDIAPTTATTATATPAATAPGQISSDFQTFLTMLTTQLQNQDPLNPLDSTDFAVQLATFAGVEQQVRSNDLLTALSDQMALVGVTQLASWVGMEARVAAPFDYKGAPIEMYGSPAAGADRAELVVRDAAGAEVYRGPVPLDADSTTWDGTDSAGKPLAPGRYTASLESFIGTESIGTAMLATYARITEVRVDNGEAVMLLENGIKVSLADIAGLREPR